ncbi:MAG TPA: alkaline phosphatase family protein [Thermoanaerobaculia bacterium]|nr:alkaline phosphatase family protein [Thermoanaerobaculia bacterium]
MRSLARRGARARRAAELVACGLAPGALAGVHLAGLIFFLNPALPFNAGSVLRAAAVYAGMLGALSLALHLPLLWLARPRRVLPWTLTLALSAAALLDWINASHFAYYLPTGINERLLKTAAWLSLAALITFYTALLHTLHRRRYGRRSRIGLGLVSALSILAMLERREAFHPRPAPPPRPAAVEVLKPPRLWVVGLDTATLDAVLPLAGEGRLPFLARVLQQGAHGRLESLLPVRPESLWITLATGKYPWQHGVAGGLLYSADRIAPGAELRLLPLGVDFARWGIPGGGSRLPRAFARQALTLWEVLPRLGVPTATVSWPASSPVSRETEFALSDRYFTEEPEAGNSAPPDLGQRARLFRPESRAVQDLLASHFGPGSSPALVEALSEDLWRESLSLALLDQQPRVGGFFLVLPGLRHISRRFFGGFSATQFHAAQAPDYRQAAERIADYYARLDAFLSELWRRNRGNDVLAVVSAYGIEGSVGWRRLWGDLSREASLEGFVANGPDGVLMLYGAGIQPGALITGARLVDVAPTLMYALGFPVARDLDGQVLTSAFDKSFLEHNTLTFLPTYEALARPLNRPSAAPPTGSAGSAAP